MINLLINKLNRPNSPNHPLIERIHRIKHILNIAGLIEILTFHVKTNLNISLNTIKYPFFYFGEITHHLLRLNSFFLNTVKITLFFLNCLSLENFEIQ